MAIHFRTREKLVVKSQGRLGYKKHEYSNNRKWLMNLKVTLGVLKTWLTFVINKFLLFQYSEGICSTSTRVLALKIAQNDRLASLSLTRVKLEVKSKGRVGN